MKNYTKLSKGSLLSKLFNWKKEIEINGVKLYQRVISDDAMEHARRMALAESNRIRQALQNPESDYYLAYIYPFEFASAEELKNQLYADEITRAVQDFVKDNPKPVLPEPDNSSVEAQLEFEEQKRLRDKEYEEEARRYAEERANRVLDVFKDNVEELRAEVISRVRRETIETEFYKLFEANIICSSLYIDPDFEQPALTIEEYRQLPVSLREKIKQEYLSLTLSQEELKK